MKINQVLFLIKGRIEDLENTSRLIQRHYEKTGKNVKRSYAYARLKARLSELKNLIEELVLRQQRKEGLKYSKKLESFEVFNYSTEKFETSNIESWKQLQNMGNQLVHTNKNHRFYKDSTGQLWHYRELVESE